jgi:hypothetical protein
MRTARVVTRNSAFAEPLRRSVAKPTGIRTGTWAAALALSAFAPHHAPLHVRLELLDRRGRRVGSSRRVTLPAGQNTRPIRVRLKRGVVVRRPAIGWRIRVRARDDRTAGVLTLPTRP